MGILNIFEIKNENNGYLGKNQEVLLIKEILGENIPKMIMQVAINKDVAERKDILDRIESIEENIKSENFNTNIDIEITNKEIMDLIFDGYKKCVLPNDTDLEIRCFNIYEDTVEYAKEYHKKEGNLTEEMNNKIDSIRNSIVFSGFLRWMTLSDSFDTIEEQYTWMIISSLINQDEVVCGFDKGNLVADVVAISTNFNSQSLDESEKFLIKEVEQLREINKNLLLKNIINNSQSETIEKLIKKGLSKKKNG